MAKQFGTYSILRCDPTATKKQKLDLIKVGIDTLIEKAKEFPSEPNINTLKFIIKEDLHFPGETDWYADEKPDYKPEPPFWAITVGVKYYEVE